MDTDSLFESVPNFSEGRRTDVIEALAGAAGKAHVLDTDADPDHNRVVISIAGSGSGLLDALMSSVRVAVDRIDLLHHEGVHPRVGAADVIPIVPLGSSTLAGAAELARELGERVWSELEVPVYFYGYGNSRRLADIRAARARPDLGGPDLHPSAGATCIGAREKLVAFNVMLPGTSMIEARQLARSLREADGGMPGVQALVFELPGGRVQLSMNLFRLSAASPGTVIADLERRGAQVGGQQIVGLCPAAAANAAASGKLLEGRLAAAAARTGALLCARIQDTEHTRLAARLEREADDLARLGIEQTELLVGAERAAALVPVLRAAQILESELASMLGVAARGLRDAISAETRAGQAARMAALESRLDEIGASPV
jgi:glutamate formiminotransferase